MKEATVGVRILLGEKPPTLFASYRNVTSFLPPFPWRLHLSKDVDTIISTNCSLAIFAARQGDAGESLRALRNTLSKVRVPEIREDLKGLIKQVEYMTENGMSMENRLDEIETFLKRVEWEG